MVIADSLLLILGFVALVFASVYDFKTREVPDWLSYSLIISGFSIRIFHSLIFSDFLYLLYGLIGFGIMFAIGLAMYYTKQWGGGDTKLIIGLGVAFISPNFYISNFLLAFIVNIILFGALYGLAWSIYFAVKNSKSFSKEFVNKFHESKNIRFISIFLGLLAIASLSFIKIQYINFIICVFALAIIVYSYLHIFVKAVEASSMYRWLPVSKLTEGDWVAKPVYVNRKLVCGPKDLGLDKKQIAILKKAKINKIFVKEGIPFVPSFLIAAIITFIFGNILLIFI